MRKARKASVKKRKYTKRSWFEEAATIPDNAWKVLPPDTKLPTLCEQL